MSRYSSTFNWKLVLGIVIGIVAAVCIGLLTVAVGCAVNGVSFGQQIVDWFGTSTKATGDAIQEVVSTTACKFIA